MTVRKRWFHPSLAVYEMHNECIYLHRNNFITGNNGWKYGSREYNWIIETYIKNNSVTHN